MSDIVIRQLELGPLQANAYLVYRVDRDDCFIVDPGDDLASAERAIKQSGRRLTDILLTHGHFDHILGAAALKKAYHARVHIHPYDAHMLQVSGASLYNPSWCRLPFVPAEADSPYPVGDDDWTISVCGITLIGFRTPGHTPGSAVVYVPERSLLLTGDNWNPCTWLFFPEALSAQELISSMKPVLALPFEHVLCSHREELHPRSRIDCFYVGLTDEALESAPAVAMGHPVDTREAAPAEGQIFVFDYNKYKNNRA